MSAKLSDLMGDEIQVYVVPCKRRPLPRRDFVTLCELVTWIATGKPLSSAVLKRLMRRHRGTRKPVELWSLLEREADHVQSLLRTGTLEAFGQADGGAHERITVDYLVSDVFADPLHDQIGPDPLAWERGTYPEGLRTYTAVRLQRSKVAHVLGAETGEETSKRIGRPRLRAWYQCRIDTWSDSPSGPSIREDWAAAKAKFGESMVTRRMIEEVRREVTAPSTFRLNQRGRKSSRPSSNPKEP